MTHEEAWQELKTRLEQAERSILPIRNQINLAGDVSGPEIKRLGTKLQGLRLAQEYMRELETSIH